MKRSRLSALVFVLLLAFVLPVVVVPGAVVAGGGSPAAAPPASPTPGVTVAPGAAGGPGTTMAVIGVIVVLLILVGVGVKMFDLKRRREAEAVHLQAQLSDALLRDGSLVGLAITPTAHIPLWAGGPATVELSGRAPSPEGRQAALRIVEREAARIRPDVKVVDRIERAA